MAQAGSGGGRGKTYGRGGREGRGSAGRASRGQGYSTKPKSTKVGLCKELEHHVFDYGGHGAADTMRITQEKIQQYAGIKYGKDIANELKNRVQVVIDQPEYTQAIKTRHIGYETLVRQKQSNLLAAMKTQLANLIATAGTDTKILLSIAKLKNEIADLEYESIQEVPFKLTAEESALYNNQGKSYSARQDKLVMVRGQVFALIFGQCTQLLQDKLKQEKNWTAVSASYKPLELYKLIESVVLKQTEDQYPVAAVWDQYCQVFNAKQGNNNNTEWYEWFSTKVEVAESVGCVFANDKTLDYCANLEYKKSFAVLGSTEQAAIKVLARERFMAFGLLKTAGSSHDKIKSDLSDDFTKGSDNYPVTPVQTLLLLDKYSKKPTVVAASEGTAFAQKGKKGEAKKDATNKKVDFDKEFYKDKECFRCGKKGHPKAACTVKLTPADDESKPKSPKSPKSSSSSISSKSDVSKMFGEMNKTIKSFWQGPKSSIRGS